MELAFLVALTLVIGLVVKLVVFSDAEDVPCLLLLISGVAGTCFGWWAYMSYAGEGPPGLGDWRHWAGALFAGAVLEFSAGTTGGRI